MCDDVAPNLESHKIFQVSHSGVKCVFHEFTKCPMIPEIELKQYARANMLLIINALGALQDN